MHEGHDHHHHGFGHNGHRAPTQWQTPHLPDHVPVPEAPAEPDLDLVEKSFLDAFPKISDATSFLRLAGVPFVGRTDDGRMFNLLRVEAQLVTDIGALSPGLGGGHRYDPLPAAMVSKRETLGFVYYDGSSPVRLSLAEARALTNLTPPV